MSANQTTTDAQNDTENYIGVSENDD